MAARKSTTFSMRMPDDLNEKIQSYAAEHNCTKAEAMSHFARAGIDLEENGYPTSAEEGSQSKTLSQINERLEALQKLPTIDPEPVKAIVPVDIRDKIQTYSTEHQCTEQEALAYYARLGVQLSDKNPPATASAVEELSRRLDALAKDSEAKTEQMKQMAEVLVTIRDYTKPDEVELEGEIAEDVEEAELSEEEKQRLADEHTRQVVSDALEDILARQQEDQAAREAEEAQALAAQRQAWLNPWIPVLVALVVSLLIGLIIVVVR